MFRSVLMETTKFFEKVEKKLPKMCKKNLSTNFVLKPIFPKYFLTCKIYIFVRITLSLR